MRPYLKILSLLVFLLVAGAQPPASATASERRFALVVGNGSYEAHPLATPANDAELIARTLQAAGFEVVHARDLKQDALRQVFSEFLEVLRRAGPDTISLVYFAGYGLQLDGENYLLPVDARIAVASDIPRYALRLSDLLQKLAALRSKAAITVLDAAWQSPFLIDGAAPAAGLAWLEPEANSLVAFNATPGMFAPDVANGYGPYARAVAEMISEAGLALPEIFLRARLRVHELTKGAQVPWHSAGFNSQFVLNERPFNRLQRSHSLEREAWLRSQAMASLGSQDAYFAALIHDTFDAYADFLADHRRDPLAKRVLAMLAARREAITWRRTCQADTPEAYWTYLERYPTGAHGTGARRRLEKLGASTVVPAQFSRGEYDIPSPLPDEQDYVGRQLPLADSAFLPEPGPGIRDIIGDAPEFPFRSAATSSAANARPAPVPSLPAEVFHAKQSDNSINFDSVQMRPSIDDRPAHGNHSSDSAVGRGSDLPQTSSVAAKTELTSEPYNKSVVPATPPVVGPSVSIHMPFWASLDPPHAATAIAGVGSLSERTALPAWANQELLPSVWMRPSANEPLWTGALTDAASVSLGPKGLAHRRQRWVTLTPEATIPLPLARPGKLKRPLLVDRAKSVVPSVTSASQTRPATTGRTQPPQIAAPLALLRPRSVRPAAISKPITARADSPAGTSSAVTTGNR